MKVISLGLGVQSTALYYMSSVGEIPRADVAIFADTGAEKTATLEYYIYLKRWMRKNNGIPIYIANYKNIKEDLIKSQNSTGQRFASIPAFTESGGQLKRQCTSEYKIQQVDKMIREICGLIPHQRYPKTEIWYGISLDEMTRMSIPQQKWKINVYPFIGYLITHDSKQGKLSDIRLTRVNIANWYKINNLPMPVKSSCYFCPYQSNKNWRILKETYPDDFNIAAKIDNIMRDSTKKGIHDKIYIHRSLKPLDQIDFSDSQMLLFDVENDECSGNCMI